MKCLVINSKISFSIKINTKLEYTFRSGETKR